MNTPSSRDDPYESPPLKSTNTSLNNPPEGGRGETSLGFNKNNNFCYTSNKLCDFYPEFRYYHPEHGFRRFNCRSWKCKSCSKRRIKRLRKAILHYILNEGFDRHLTITLDPKKAPEANDPKQSFSYLMRVWAKLRTYIAWKTPWKIRFIWFVEPHPNSGRAHLHVLLDQYIPQEWLSSRLDRIGGGKICWIRRIKKANKAKVAYYVSKYISKLDNIQLPPYKRRFSSSHGVKLWQFKPEPGWKVVMPFVVFWGITWRIIWVRADRRDFALAKSGLSPPPGI